MDELDELPLQTYERVTGQKWPGGKSPMVRLMLAIFKIDEDPGSAAANLKLQASLRETFVRHLSGAI